MSLDLLKERFGWMNNFIGINDHGVELGSGAGFAKHFINCKNFKISDLSNYDHLDYKNIDAQETGFQSESFNFVIASNMIHHIPYPMKFFKEMNRVLKKDGKFVSKIFMGSTFNEIIKESKKIFKENKVFKPAASRKDSKESFIICKYLR